MLRLRGVIAPDASSPHVPIREDWLATTAEPVLDPGLPIVDAHHHLWDRSGARYLYPDFRADLGSGHDIRATVYVQCRSMYRTTGPEEMRPVGEVEFAAGVAAEAAGARCGGTEVCAAIVAFADLRVSEAVAPVLATLIAAAGGRLRGIRNTTAAHPDPRLRSNPAPPPSGILREPGFLRGAALLARFGLTLDVWAYHTQLGEVAALARACPETVIVLDHCGGPLGTGPYAGRRAEVYVEWHAAMAQLAALPNVVVKLGGLAMRVGGFDFHLRPRAPHSAQLTNAWRPYILALIDLFGVRRCMFESNFPVDKGMVGYAVLWNTFKRLTSGASAEERLRLFSGTARDIYRLPARPEAA